MHLAPEARADEQPFGGRVEHHALFAVAIEKAQADGAGDADAKLAELLVRMEAAANSRLSAVDPVDAANGERQRPAELGDGKSAAGVAALRDINELDEG
jgi:hypothetical protein